MGTLLWRSVHKPYKCAIRPRALFARTAPTALSAALALTVLIWSGTLFRALGYTAIVTFGDSYTDTGNAPSSPPYYWNGRFSNGPLWVETLSQTLGFSYYPWNNFAVSGTEAEDLGTQINNFPGTTDSANVLFAIWSGNNDFGNHLNLGTSDSAWNTRINSIVSSLMTASDLLYQKGARTIVIFNQLDLTQAPYIRSNYSASFRSYIVGKIQTFNSRLSSSIPGLLNTHAGLQVYLLDIYSDFNYLLGNSYSYGFTTATVDALDDPKLGDKSFTGPGANYVFWDNQHPTTKTHGIVASWVNGILPPPSSPPTISLVNPQDGTQFAAPANISINASLNANGWNISQVAFFHDGALLGQVSSPPWSMNWLSAPAGAYALTAQVTYGSGQTLASAPLHITVATPLPLPTPWSHQDIGAVGQAGNASYATNGVFTVTGSGADIWNTADAFHFVYQSWNGDGTIIARITGVQNTDGFAKACLMFRETLAPGAPNAAEFVTPTSGTGFQWRSVAAGSSGYNAGSTGAPPYWLKLQRVGNTFNGYDSPDGSSWTLTGTTSITMASNTYAGLAVTAHNNSLLNTSTFTAVQVAQPGRPALLAIKRLADGSIQLTISGAIGATYRSDASSDLLVWTPVATNLNASGTFQFTDPQSRSLSRRYYRAVLLQ